MDVRTEGAFTDIEVDQNHFFLRLCHTCREVAAHKGLTGFRSERAESYYLQVLALDTHELHVGSHDAEGLGSDVTSLTADNNAFFALCTGLFGAF